MSTPFKETPETCPHCGEFLRNICEDGQNYECGTRTLDGVEERSVACCKKEIGIRTVVLRGLLQLHDEESGMIDVRPNPSCPECTLGTVPNSLNKGLCFLHRAKQLTQEDGI